MKSITFTLFFLLAIPLIMAMDPRDRELEDRHSKSSMFRHLTHHLEELDRNNNELAKRLSKPDLSMEERKDIMRQMDLIQRKKTSIQAQIEHHMKVRIDLLRDDDQVRVAIIYWTLILRK